MKSLVQKCAAVMHRLSITVPGSQIPDWFGNHRLGNTIKLKLPQNHIIKVTGVALCCRFLPPLKTSSTVLKITFKGSNEENLISRAATEDTQRTKFVWTGYLPLNIIQDLCHSFESEDLLISFEDNVDVCGACVIYKDDIKPVIGTGSWIPDYDDLMMVDHESTSSDDWHHGRWFKPIFFVKSFKIGDPNTVEVWGESEER
ncbi:hypothetical protein QVD17_36109 [Tagetes erecta]|uniref:C-JID domain-containing protein n=1 Tax=Tagetes erecta TaxID=13708 RepID=A0AAD8JS25_TARER|nr:hypothetical protein QVD17_36109 [Tagetes erecta]